MCTGQTDKQIEIVHSEACLKNKALAEAWFVAHPNACKHCLGYGGFSSYSWEEGYDFDFCSACVGEGKCPMCGVAQGEDWEGTQCAACGWDWEKTEEAGIDWECLCWLEAAEKENEAADREYRETLRECEFPLTDSYYVASDFAYDEARDNRFR